MVRLTSGLPAGFTEPPNPPLQPTEFSGPKGAVGCCPTPSAAGFCRTMKLPPRVRTRVPVRAFTLVEVAIAAGVMALGLVGMIQVVVSGSQMLDVARKQNIAMQVIHGQIDQIRLRTWSEIEALPATVTVRVDASDYDGDQAMNVSRGFVFGSNLPTVCTGFRCKREVVAVSGRADFKQITFTVTWTGNTGRAYSRSGTTYVGKNGLYVTYQRS